MDQDELLAYAHKHNDRVKIVTSQSRQIAEILTSKGLMEKSDHIDVDDDSTDYVYFELTEKGKSSFTSGGYWHIENKVRESTPSLTVYRPEKTGAGSVSSEPIKFATPGDSNLVGWRNYTCKSCGASFSAIVLPGDRPYCTKCGKQN